jgi:hypothetical protein
MRIYFSRPLCVALLAASAMTIALPASAADVKMVGVVEKIQLAPDGKSAQAVLKDSKSGNSVVIFITDDETLDKFKDKRIGVGEEIRARYDDTGGKNLSKFFKKTAGC